MKTVDKVAAVSGGKTVSIYQPDRVTEVFMRRADAEYWQILDFKVLTGRVPNEDDVKQGRFVAVLNESTAKKIFADGKALGKKINAGGQQFEVIGVVEDVLHLNAFADIWVPVTTFPTSQYRDEYNGEFFAMLLAKSPADLPLIKDEIQQIAKLVNADDPQHWEHTYLWADSKLDFVARNILGHREIADSGATQLLMRHCWPDAGIHAVACSQSGKSQFWQDHGTRNRNWRTQSIRCVGHSAGHTIYHGKHPAMRVRCVCSVLCLPN